MSTNPSPPTSLAVWMIFFTSPSIPGKPLKSLTALLHKFFQHALTVSGFNSSIAALMKVISSAMLKDFKQFLTWSFGSASMAARNIFKTWRGYEALTHLMIPWSSGWSSEVVFGGKNTTWTFSKYHLNFFKIPTEYFQNTTWTFSKYHLIIFKIPPKHFQNTTRPFTKYHLNIFKIPPEHFQNTNWSFSE